LVKKVLGDKMLEKNRINMIGLVAIIIVFGSSSHSQAVVACPSPAPTVTNWACVDTYLTPPISNIEGVQFQVNNDKMADLYSVTSINEAVGMLYLTNPTPVATTDNTRIAGAAYNPFTSSLNPLFNLKYALSTGVFPRFTVDSNYFAFSPASVTPDNIMLKAQYVLNNGTTIIDNGYPLDLSISGSGTGTVTSSPAGISCSGGTCRYPFSISTQVTLTAAPTNGSCFSAFTYTGGSTNSNPYNISSYDPASTASVTAQFSPSNAAITSPSATEYCTLQEAVNAASTGSSVLARGGVLSNTLVMNRSNTTITLKGGYTSFTSTSSGFTSLSGPLTIQQGTLVVDNIAIL